MIRFADMPSYSPISEVDEGFRRWVREEDPPAGLLPASVTLEALRAAVEAAEPEARVHPIVTPAVEHSALAAAVKVTKLVPGPLYTQLDVHVSSFGRLAHVVWESRATKEQPDPTLAATAPNERAARVEAAVRRWLDAAGLALVTLDEARRVVTVTDDPFYDGESYDITVFEVLFGMGYPERQR